MGNFLNLDNDPPIKVSGKDYTESQYEQLMLKLDEYSSQVHLLSSKLCDRLLDSPKVSPYARKPYTPNIEQAIDSLRGANYSLHRISFASDEDLFLRLAHRLAERCQELKPEIERVITILNRAKVLKELK